MLVHLLDMSNVIQDPDLDLVNVKLFCSHHRNSSQLMNSDPLSESIPSIGNATESVSGSSPSVVFPVWYENCRARSASPGPH